MGEIVASVQRVTDVIGEITAASTEQSQGIASVNSAVSNLDQMTQQNAALVEQSAAAAESLKDQAQRLTQVVGTFRLDAGPAALPPLHATAPAHAAHAAFTAPAAPARPAPAPAVARAPAAAPRAPAASHPAPASPAPRQPAPRQPVATAETADADWESF